MDEDIGATPVAAQGTPAPSAAAASPTDDRRARRNALLLAAAYALSGSIMPIGFALGGLIGLTLAPESPGIATLPVSASIIGGAVGAAPAALLMQRIGRRPGFLIGTGVALAGALLALVAIYAESFWLFAVAMFVVGTSVAFGQQYRFAATDTASPSFRARAISWVMAGGVVSGVVGPQAALHGRDLLPTPFVGAFIIVACLIVAAMGILWFLDIPKPRAAARGGRPLRQIVRQPRLLVSLACAIGAFSMMSLVMTAAPVAMVEHHGHTNENATLAIQWHVIAMFAPSFFTGSLIQRFGKEVMVAVGLLVLALCAGIALAGVDLMNFWVALILLGVGWNFAFIGATAMLAETYRPEEAARVQAFNETVLFSFVAVASLSAGTLLSTGGWDTVNTVVLPVVALCLVLLASLAWSRRRPA